MLKKKKINKNKKVNKGKAASTPTLLRRLPWACGPTQSFAQSSSQGVKRLKKKKHQLINGPYALLRPWNNNLQSNAKTVMYSIEIEEAKILHVRDEGHAFHELSPN